MDLKQAFKELWTWMAGDPLRSKCDWPGFAEFESVKNECPACEHARLKTTGDNECEHCPIEPSAKQILGAQFDQGDCLGGLYTRFTRAAYVYQRAKALEEDAEIIEDKRISAVNAAKAIRDLEWKE